jgi:hypothetical protein
LLLFFFEPRLFPLLNHVNRFQRLLLFVGWGRGAGGGITCCGGLLLVVVLPCLLLLLACSASSLPVLLLPKLLLPPPLLLGPVAPVLLLSLAALHT